MTIKKDYAVQITEGVIWKQLLAFFFPIMIGSFFQQLYNTVDTVIVGQFVGKEALAAVGGSSAQIVNLVVGFFTGLSSGASVIIAHFFGADDRKSVIKAVHNAYLLAAAGGVILSVAGILLTPSMLSWMHTPAEIMDDAVLYLQIYFGAIVFNFIYNMGSSIMRAAGDSKTPPYCLIICCFINIGLDVLLVGVWRKGVFGAAAATFLSQALSGVLVTLFLVSDKGALHLSCKEIRFSGSILASQLRMGFPTALESILFAITNIAIQAVLNTFGTDTVAAWSAFGKMDAVFWMVSTSFGIAITSFAGQNYGAGRLDRVRKSTAICLLMDFCISSIIVITLILFRIPLFGLFTADQNVIEIGSWMVLEITPWYIVYIFIEILAGSLRGEGDVMIPLFITLFGICLLRIIWLEGAMILSPTIQTIIFSYPVTWLFTAVIFILYYLKKVILENKKKTR